MTPILKDCPAGNRCHAMLCDRCSASKAKALIEAGEIPADAEKEWRGNTKEGKR